MRVVRSASAMLVGLGVVLPGAVARGQQPEAAPVLAAARAALGGDTALRDVKTLVASGRTRQIRGNNVVPIEFDIACELPDACVRREEFPAQNLDVTVMGFRGDALVQFPSPPSERGGASSVPSVRAVAAPSRPSRDQAAHRMLTAGRRRWS